MAHGVLAALLQLGEGGPQRRVPKDRVVREPRRTALCGRNHAGDVLLHAHDTTVFPDKVQRADEAGAAIGRTRSVELLQKLQAPLVPAGAGRAVASRKHAGPTGECAHFEAGIVAEYRRYDTASQESGAQGARFTSRVVGVGDIAFFHVRIIVERCEPPAMRREQIAKLSKFTLVLRRHVDQHAASFLTGGSAPFRDEKNVRWPSGKS